MPRALVIGGSIAGQLAAAALARRGFEATILDRDTLPDSGPRKGLPQARHVHALMVSGQRTLETLLPGITAALTAAGAVPLTWTADVAFHTLAGWHRNFPSDLVSCFMTRDLLDREIRRAVAALPGVRTCTGQDVTGLTAAAGRVTGVRLREAGRGLDAELVVDASGRDSRAPEWLAALGYGAVEEAQVDAFLGYTSRLVRPPPGLEADWKAMIARSRKVLTRAGGIVPVEGGRWLVTLAGFSRDYPPRDDDGFMDFAVSLAVPEFAAALRAAEPLTPAVGYRRTTNRWRRYHAMPRWPDGFVALGDAVCAFNPYYGQGMSVAALAARALGELVDERGSGPGFAAAFQRRLAAVLAAPWLMATSEECRYPETLGAVRGWRTRLNLWYTDRLFERAARDPAVMRAFLGAFHLLEPYGTLMRPGVMLPVLLRPRAGAPPAPPRVALPAQGAISASVRGSGPG